MLNTPFVIDFVPVPGGTAMRSKEKVPEVPVAVRVVNVIVPLPPSTAFASQSCVPPMVSCALAPLERADRKCARPAGLSGYPDDLGTRDVGDVV